MAQGRGFRGHVAAAAVLAWLPSLLAGCADLAEGGPRATAIASHDGATLPYRLVPLTPAVVGVVSEAEPDRLAGAFPANKPPARLTLGVGDILSISVYEASVGGLFIPGDSGARPANNVSLPNEAVDNAGNISFPFGGAIKAAGRTTRQVQDAILARIRDRAIDPQVIVTVVSQQTSMVSVEGDVRRPLRYPAAPAGAQDRITDALTRAGGLAGQGYESFVTLTRDGRSATMPFEGLLMHGSDDIFVQPGDRILVTRQPQRFIAFGALGRRAPAVSDGFGDVTALPDGGGRAEIAFDSWRLSLAEALAKAGGLLDTRADPGAVFLYRREPAAVAARLGLDPGPLAVMPVIFRLDLSDPSGFALATRFPMRNGDLLYVANAPASEFDKALGYFNTYLSMAVNGTTAALVANSALRGNGDTGLPVIGGLTLVPSGVTGLPGTVTPSGIINGVTPTTTPTGGTADSGGTVASGTTKTTTSDQTTLAPLVSPRSTMNSPASR